MVKMKKVHIAGNAALTAGITSACKMLIVTPEGTKIKH
jgi:hypothetical protein